jgi:hypothetical protein
VSENDAQIGGRTQLQFVIQNNGREKDNIVEKIMVT